MGVWGGGGGGYCLLSEAAATCSQEAEGAECSSALHSLLTSCLPLQVRYHVSTEPELKPLLDEINQQIQKEKDEES